MSASKSTKLNTSLSPLYHPAFLRLEAPAQHKSVNSVRSVFNGAVPCEGQTAGRNNTPVLNSLARRANVYSSTKRKTTSTPGVIALGYVQVLEAAPYQSEYITERTGVIDYVKPLSHVHVVVPRWSGAQSGDVVTITIKKDTIVVFNVSTAVTSSGDVLFTLAAGTLPSENTYVISYSVDGIASPEYELITQTSPLQGFATYDGGLSSNVTMTLPNLVVVPKSASTGYILAASPEVKASGPTIVKVSGPDGYTSFASINQAGPQASYLKGRIFQSTISGIGFRIFNTTSGKVVTSPYLLKDATYANYAGIDLHRIELVVTGEVKRGGVIHSGAILHRYFGENKLDYMTYMLLRNVTVKLG